MGYGHQRAAFPLRDFAVGLDGIKSKDAIINANHYAGIPNADRRRWDSGRRWYERISRLKNLPLIGESIFSIMDYFQRIEPFYPKRDLSKPTIQLKTIYSMIRKGWGRDLIQRLNKNPLPLINTFFSPAYFAEEHGYKGDIYLICCDTDVSRAWAPLVPNKSRIKYLVPNRRVKERLGLYGVKQDRFCYRLSFAKRKYRRARFEGVEKFGRKESDIWIRMGGIAKISWNTKRIFRK